MKMFTARVICKSDIRWLSKYNIGDLVEVSNDKMKYLHSYLKPVNEFTYHVMIETCSKCGHSHKIRKKEILIEFGDD